MKTDKMAIIGRHVGFLLKEVQKSGDALNKYLDEILNPAAAPAK